MWIIEKIIRKGDYKYALVPNHPNSTNNGYVLEHRIVMENHLGRLLTKDEVVHHINGNRKDNRLENLQLMNNKEHNRFHGSKGISMVKIKCPICNKVFDREKRRTHLINKKRIGTFCSKSCGAKLQWKIKKDGLIENIKKSIKENVMFEFKIKEKQVNGLF